MTTVVSYACEYKVGSVPTIFKRDEDAIEASKLSEIVLGYMRHGTPRCARDEIGSED